ncbi:MAG: TolC family protein [Ichthyobacteriaceae bacterium]|nr:TolC family protein [Ichthyobacteriaceae bacterium]
MKKLFTIVSVLLLFQNAVSAQEKDANISMSLSEAKTYAQEHNYKLKNAKLDVQIAQKKIWETTAIGLPQVNGKLDYIDNLTLASMPFPTKNPVTGADTTMYIQMGTAHNLSAAITVSQLIFDGSYLVGLQSSKTYKKISELAELKTKTLINEAVTNAYGGVVLSNETVKLLDSNVETLEGNLNQTKAYYQSGLIEEQSVEQLQILLSSTKNLLFSAKNDLHTSKKMLNYLLGIEINDTINLTSSLESILIENINIGVTEQQFLSENSIDILIEDNKVRSQELLEKFEKSKFLPSVSAFYQIKEDAFADEFTFFEGNQDWFGAQMLGVSVSVPIFSSGSRCVKVQQAKIELEKAKNTRVETQQNLILNVEKAKNKYLSAINQYYTAKQNMELSKKIRNKEEVKYFEGMSSSLDLSNVEVQMISTQQSYIRSIFGLIQAKASIDRLLSKAE